MSKDKNVNIAIIAIRTVLLLNLKEFFEVCKIIFFYEIANNPELSGPNLGRFIQQQLPQN